MSHSPAMEVGWIYTPEVQPEEKECDSASLIGSPWARNERKDKLV